MADKVTEMLEQFTSLAQCEKQLSADTDNIFKEYNDYLASCEVDLKEKTEEIREKMSRLDYYLNYAKEHAQADELEAATAPFETDEGHLESLRQTIKLDSRQDPNAESLYTKVTGMQLYYEQKIEETRRLIESSKVQAKRQYDADVADLNRRKDEQDNRVREYIRSDDFKEYLRLLTFDKSAFNSTGTAKIHDNNTISLGQRRVRLTVPMDIEQDLALISNNEYNAGARTIGVPFRISMKRGGVICLDFDDRNKQYLIGGIQRLLLNAVKYFGDNFYDMLFCEPENFSPDCLGQIAAFGRGANPLIIIPESTDDIEARVKEYFADIEKNPTNDTVSRIVVMHCFPEKYSADIQERVLNLCKNAEKLGVLVITTHYNAESDGDIGAQIREMGISVRSKNGGFWIERLRESLFWYSAPSDIPADIRRNFIDNRRVKVKTAPEPIPEPVAAVEPEIPEEFEIPEEPIPEIEEFVGDMFENTESEDEPAVDTLEDAVEPVADMFEETNEPEPAADMFEEMSEPEPVADMFEETSEPEPVADMFEEASEPEPVADMFEEASEPEPVADMFEEASEPEPVQDVFEEMSEPEPVADMFEETSEPESVTDMFEETSEPEPVQDVFENTESENEPENIPAHVLFANRPKPADMDVTITPLVQMHETLPPVNEPGMTETNLVAEQMPEPVAESTPEPVAEPMPQPVAEPMPEPVAEPMPEPVAEPMPQPVAEPMPQPVAEPMPQPVAETSEKTVDSTEKCTRVLPLINLGMDVNEDNVTFDVSGNITYICGAPCAERRRLLDAIIKTITFDCHPDDTEFWMFDCGGEELLRYSENPAPHIRYLVNDGSEETTFDLIDTLDAEMLRRAELLSENKWKTFAAIPGNIYLPRIFVVINNFPKMLANMEAAPKYFGRGCLDKAKDMFKRCDEYGIHFLLIGETFAVNNKRPACFEGYTIHSGAAVSGCDDGVQTLFSSLRLYENEIESLKRIPGNCAFVADINSTVGLTLVRFTGKLPESNKRYHAVSDYSANPAEYVDKHAMVGDKRDSVRFEERREVREKLLAKRAEDEILMFVGEPCRFMSQYPVRLCRDFGENVLAVMPRREKQVAVAVIMSALRSLIEQGISVDVITTRSNPIYAELSAMGIPEGVSVFESERGVERICEIASEIESGNASESVEIVIGGDLIFAAMHAEDKIGDLKSALVNGSRHGVHFMFTTTGVTQMSTGFLSMFRHKIVLSCPQNDAEKVLRDFNVSLPENAFRLSDDYDELTIIPYLI